MKIKKFVSVILAVIMISAAVTAAPLSANAEDEPTDNNAVITVTNNINSDTATISCKVGDIVTINTCLDTSGIDSGKIASVEGTQTFSAESLTLADKIDIFPEDGETYSTIKDTDKVFPIMKDDTITNVDSGSIFFAGSNFSNNPFIFNSPGSILISTTYRVTAAGSSTVKTSLATIALSDNKLTKIVSRSKVVQAYAGRFSLSSGLAGNIHDLAHIEAAAPTKSNDGNIEYWKCSNCGCCFSDENAENDITLASTVIHHPYVVGQTLSLKDNIGVNFYLHIPDYFTDNLSDDQISVAFSWGEGQYKKTSGCTLNDPDNPLLNRTSQYGADFKATCMVAASRMVDTISMSFKCSGEEILTSDYRIVNYAKTAAAVYNNDSKLKDLLCYMLEYGGSVQKYNGYKATTDPASNYISEVYSAEEWNLRKVTAPESIENDPTTLLKDDQDFIDALGIQFAGANLATTSQTEIRLSFSVINEDLFSATTASVGGRNIAFTDYETNGNVYKRIIIDKISAKNTFDPITVTFTNGNNTVSRVYSAVNYYNALLSNQYADTNAKNATKAMYLYSMSAAARLKQPAQ